MKKLWRAQAGFTLTEVLVAVGILTIIMGTIGAALFQALGTEKEVIDDGLAIYELRKGFSWFSSDVRKGKTTDLVDGGPAASSVTFTWTDEYQGAGTSHTVTYSLVGDSLIRTYDGNSRAVARRVVGVAFSRSGKTVTAQLQVNAEPATTRSLSVKAVMRSTP